MFGEGVAVAALLLFVLHTNCAFAQTLGRGVDGDISFWHVLAALILCIALAIGGILVLRLRMGLVPLLPLPSFAANRSRRLRLIETLHLAHQIDLCIVACDDREMLVLASAKGAEILDHSTAASSANRPLERA